MGGGGGSFWKTSPTDLRDRIRKAEEESSGTEFQAKLSGVLSELLTGYNERDVETVSSRLDDIKEALAGEITGSLDQLYGGSVAKHTYVDGISDIDSLVFVEDTHLEHKKPKVVLEKMEAILKESLAGDVKISHGHLAVTATYRDGMVIQVLPAMRTDGVHLRIPSARSTEWSRIDPQKFQEALTRRNQQCAGKLIPTIKLAKAIVGQLPEKQRLSGYHMESLGIAAFKGYTGDRTTSAMLPYFFSKAKELVLSPIRDKSGQSVHVDGYLNEPGSAARRSASHLLGRIESRMRNATAAASVNQWKALFEED